MWKLVTSKLKQNIGISEYLEKINQKMEAYIEFENIPLRQAILQQPRYGQTQHQRDIRENRCFHCHQIGHQARFCANSGGYMRRGADGLPEPLPGIQNPMCAVCRVRHRIRYNGNQRIVHSSVNCPFPVYGYRRYCGCGRELERCWNCGEVACSQPRRDHLRHIGHTHNKCPHPRYIPGMDNAGVHHLRIHHADLPRELSRLPIRIDVFGHSANRRHYFQQRRGWQWQF